MTGEINAIIQYLDKIQTSLKEQDGEVKSKAVQVIWAIIASPLFIKSANF